MGKKQDVLERLFLESQASGNPYLSKTQVRRACDRFQFGNQFDATKVDHSRIYPDVMKRGDGHFIIHLGEGNHQFVPNMSVGYHRLEAVLPTETQDWLYRPSLLNEYDSSESNILSVAFNQRILHQFLYDSVGSSPNLYLPRRTKISGAYRLDGKAIEYSKLQMEMDAVVELDNEVTIIEAKNGFPDDFAVGQLFHPYLYFDDLRTSHELDIKRIQCCYLQRSRRTKRGGGSVIRLHLYEFNGRELASIRLLRKAEYRLKMAVSS